MLDRIHTWYHTVNTTDSGSLLIMLLVAIIGGVATYYIVKYADAWASRRSEKKRKQTIVQLKEEVASLREYHRDRDKLFVFVALSAFGILALLAAGPVFGEVSHFLNIVTEAGAFFLALYNLRFLLNVARFEDYEKEIEEQIKKLSVQGQPDPVNHSLTIAATASSNAQLHLEIAPASSPLPLHEDWNTTGGLWTINPDGLELTSMNPDGSAAYIWQTDRLRLPAVIKFKATFTSSNWPGLRVNLFADSPDETYLVSDHIQLLIPWENGGYKMDYMFNGARSVTGTVEGPKPSPGETYSYEIDINLDRVLVRLNGQIQFAADIKNNLEIRQHILKLPNSGSYWGFAAQGGLYIISELTIVSF